MALIIKAPEPILFEDERIGISLVGSLGNTNWREQIKEAFRDYNMIIYDLKRDDWDPTWKQERDNPKFREQVEWELDAQENADLIVMYFDPDTKSPITLLELGLFAGSRDIHLCCPEGFWKKGNVDIVCERYGEGTIQFDSLEDLIDDLKGNFDYLKIGE